MLIDYDARIAEIREDRKTISDLIYNAISRPEVYRLGNALDQWQEAKIAELKRLSEEPNGINRQQKEL